MGFQRPPGLWAAGAVFMIRLLLATIAVLATFGMLTGAAGFGVPDMLILGDLRLPRTALALLVGGGLGLSGAVLQGALRNPLADPGLLGIGGCAGLAAVVAFYWGVSAAFPPALPLAGLIGAGLGCAFLLAAAGRAISGPSLILAGVALSAIAAALLALALTLAPNPYALAEITFWLMGGLDDRSLLHLALAAPPILAGVLLLLRLGPGLDALALGEDAAASLGMPAGARFASPRSASPYPLAPVRRWPAASVSSGSSCRTCCARSWASAPELSAARGARRRALLLAADLLARVLPLLLPLAQEPRLGVLTALLGAPFLVRIARNAAP